MQVSVNWLAENLKMHGATVRKRISDLARDKDAKVELRAAMEAIFGGRSGANGEFVSQPEAVRRLTIAKEAQIALEMEITRGERIPLEDVSATANEVFMAIAGTIKANRDKVLTESLINEMFSTLRDWAEREFVEK